MMCQKKFLFIIYLERVVGKQNTPTFKSLSMRPKLMNPYPHHLTMKWTLMTKSWSMTIKGGQLISVKLAN